MKASEYNNFSPSMKRTLKQDERASYRILNVRPDPDNFGKFLMPAAHQIPSTDQIYDKQKSEFVNIAAIESQNETKRMLANGSKARSPDQSKRGLKSPFSSC